MCSRAAAPHHVIGEGKSLFTEAPLGSGAPGTFLSRCSGPCTSSSVFAPVRAVPGERAAAALCSECPAQGGGVRAGPGLMRLMRNPRHPSGLPRLALWGHFALMPPRENWSCLVGTSAVLSVPFPVAVSGMRCWYSGRHYLICWGCACAAGEQREPVSADSTEQNLPKGSSSLLQSTPSCWFSFPVLWRARRGSLPPCAAEQDSSYLQG